METGRPKALVPVTGHNAKRALFGAINPRTSRRVATVAPAQRWRYFQQFLKELQHRYPGKKLALLIDKAPCHVPKTLERRLKHTRIEVLWLPKQWSELNAMDHLWRHVN